MKLRDAERSGNQLSRCCNIPEKSIIYAHKKSFKTSKRVTNNPTGTQKQVYSHIKVRNFMAATVQGLLTFNQ
jgi:hypothetical protein